MRLVLWTILAALVLYVVFVIGPAVVGFFMIFRRQKPRDFERTDMTGTSYEPYMPEILRTLRHMKKKPFETVEIRSADGLLLKGRYLDLGARKTAICFHGYRATPLGNFSGVGEYLSETEHFNLLLTEQRAANGSEGKFTSMGIREQADVRSWIRFAEERGAEEILLYGMSMGACSVGLGADRIRSDKVKGIILDSGFSSPKNQLIKQASDRHAPGFLLAPVLRILGFWVFKGDLYDRVPEHMARCRIPVFFLHAETDDVVPFRDTNEMYEACRAPKMKLLTKTGGHTTAFYAENQKVKECIHTFLETYFAG